MDKQCFWLNFLFVSNAFVGDISTQSCVARPFCWADEDMNGITCSCHERPKGLVYMYGILTKTYIRK